MNFSQFNIGQSDLVDLIPEDGELPQSWPRDSEVKLSLLQDTVALRRDGALKIVTPTPKSASVIARFASQPQPRIARIADISDEGVRLEVFSFSSALTLDIDLGVDEALVKKARRLQKNVRNIGDAVRWLNKQCLLSEPTRAVLSYGKDKALGDHFQVHGTSMRAVVKRVKRSDGESVLRVVRVIRGPGNSDKFPLALATGNIRFVDGSEEHRLRMESRATIEELRGVSDSIMNLWAHYSTLEGEMLLRRARAVGALRYTGWQWQADGSARFHLKIPPGEDPLSHLQKEDTLEIDDAPPAALMQGELSWAQYLETQRARKEEQRRKKERGTPRISGKLTQRPRRGGDLILKPRDADRFRPPKKGVLYLSLVGDVTRLERREQARQQIWGAESLLPQLAPLLEGRPVTSVSRDSPRMPRSVERKIFGKLPPTDTQRRAIQIALETPDLVIIQGPPGTGKTTVIRAIVECLNHQLRTPGGAPGAILITSFQHVAVNNAIGKMLVNGLPAIKLGSGGEGVSMAEFDQRTDSWRRKRIQQIQDILPAMPEADAQRRVREAVQGYLLTPSTPRETLAVVLEITQLAQGMLSTSLLDELHALARSLEWDATPAGDSMLNTLIAAVRRLRTVPPAWDDDGPLVIDQVCALGAQTGLIPSQECDKLVAAARKPNLKQIARLQRGWLLRLIRLQQPALAPASIRADIAELLVAVREAVDEATLPRRQGPDAVVARFAAALEADPVSVRDAIIRYTPVFAATCQQAASRQAALAKSSNIRYEAVIVDEAARANPLDLLVPMAQGRRIILVGDHLQLPHIIDEQIMLELTEGQTDESARDRADRALRDSLFERMFNDLSGRAGPERVITLNDQFRMHPTLGSFVSREFYGGAVRSPRPTSHFTHRLPGLADKAAVWASVPATQGRENDGMSKSRDAEVDRVVELLTQLMTSEVGKTLSFGVISFYAAQVKAIGRALSQQPQRMMEPDGGSGDYRVSDAWRWLERPGEPEPRLQVGTVDAFQGREYDVVLLSMVRSNERPDETPRQQQGRYGHLMSNNRLCVAMSRQKRMLIVVGDEGMLAGSGAEAAIGPLVRFYELTGGHDGARI